MIRSLEHPNFFSAEDHAKLLALGLHDSGNDALAFAALLLSPLLDLCLADGATTTSEFTVIEECVRSLEREFELGTEEDLESAGTAMGLLPFVPSQWTEPNFTDARLLLAKAIDRLTEAEQFDVCNWLSRKALEVADASGGLLHLLTISRNERVLLHTIIEDLHLSRCVDGMHLIEKTNS